MFAQVFWCSAARRPLCSPRCLLLRRTGADYSQSVLSSVVSSVQDPRASSSALSNDRTRTVAWRGPHYGVTDAKSPLDPTRLDRYLASIGTADPEPTLGDLERCKPQCFSSPDSSRYAAEYADLLETLCRSFSKEQLRRFTELYKLDSIWTRSSRRKAEYAESIIEKAWGWPSLKEIERKRRDATEVLVKSFTVTPSQLFLIMGKDGTDLLQLSTQYNVHVSLTSNPLALRVEGLRGSLKGLTEHVSCLKKCIIEEISELPSGHPVRSDLLQSISRLSAAYIENHGNRGKVRICAKNRSDIIAAKKLALRASLEIETQKPTICYDPPRKIRNSPIEIAESQRYAIYPFVTPWPLPWTMHSGSVFRLRRVADWLGVECYEDVASTGGLTDNPRRLLNLHRGVEELNQLISSTLPKNTLYCKRSIVASLGHLLLSSSGDNLQRNAILPPLRGTLPLPDILKWFETSGTPLIFVPSVPTPVMAAIVYGQRNLHQLVYRTLPQIADQVSKPSQHVLKFEMELSCPPSTSTPAAQNSEHMPELDDLESNLSGMCNSSQVDPSRSDGALSNGSDASCQVGREAYINLMLPDRPMDIQLSIFDWDDVSLMQQPQALREYTNKLRDFLINEGQLLRPDPPSAIIYQGRTYYLHQTLNSRRSHDSILSSLSNDCCPSDAMCIFSENINDLQTTQKIEQCQVIFNGAPDASDWKCFLATCDHLTMAPLESRRRIDKR